MKTYKWKKIYVKIFFNQNLNYSERELFVSLILACDNHGRYYADPKKIKELCYKNIDEVDEQKIWQTLKSLENKGFLTIYNVGSQNFLYILNYLRYNPLYYNSKSDFPDPPDEIMKHEREQLVKKEFDEIQYQQIINELIEKYPMKSKYQMELSREILSKKIKTKKDYETCKNSLDSYINFIKFLQQRFRFIAFQDASTFFNNYEKFSNSYENAKEYFEETENKKNVLFETIKKLDEKFNLKNIDEAIEKIKKEEK